MLLRARAVKSSVTRAAHTLATGCALLLFAGCGEQPTSPNLSMSGGPITTSDQGTPGEFRRCLKGTFDGVWIKDDGFEDRGRMEAAWISSKGDTLGMLSGVFGPDPADETLRWRATVSGVTLAVVLYELSGTFSYTDPRMCPLCGTGQGGLAGNWREVRTGRRGRLAGEWGDIFLPFEERRMPISGRWSAACGSQGTLEIQEKPE